MRGAAKMIGIFFTAICGFFLNMETLFNYTSSVNLISLAPCTIAMSTSRTDINN